MRPCRLVDGSEADKVDEGQHEGQHEGPCDGDVMSTEILPAREGA